MPGKTPRTAPGRDSTRPGVRREPRMTARTGDEPTPVSASASDSTAQSRPQARSRVFSTMALGVTHRIIALVATAAVLLISFVSSYSVYLGQQRDMAEVRAEIAAHQTEITRLQDELQRWQDPAYVEAQARDRLGWVMPGEVGYRVIDADGNIIGGTVDTAIPEQEAPQMIWYDALLTSLKDTDHPAPAEPTLPTATSPVIVGPDGVETPR